MKASVTVTNNRKRGQGQHGEFVSDRRVQQATIQSFFSACKRSREISGIKRIIETPPSPVAQREVKTPPTTLPIRSCHIRTPPSPTVVDLPKLKKSLSTKSSSDFTQMYLDFGQSNFGKQMICKVCGMLAVHGLDEDSKEHARICQDYLHGVPFHSTTKARIVMAFDKGTIYEVRPSDSYELRKKVKRVRVIVDKELGFVPASTSTTSQDKTAYFYVVKKRVVGFATAEVLSKAFALSECSSERSNEERKAMVGIHQLWVHSKFRKDGIATNLVEAIRRKFIYGLTVPRQMMAFSSPTEAGMMFARGYMRKSSNDERLVVLVYDCICTPGL